MHCNSYGGWTKSNSDKSLTWKSVNGPHRYLFVGAIHKRVATFYEKGCTERYLPLLKDTFQVQRARLLAHVPNVKLIHFVVYKKRATVLQRGSPLSRRSDGQCLEREPHCRSAEGLGVFSQSLQATEIFDGRDRRRGCAHSRFLLIWTSWIIYSVSHLCEARARRKPEKVSLFFGDATKLSDTFV